jgi:hypothetical protein
VASFVPQRTIGDRSETYSWNGTKQRIPIFLVESDLIYFEKRPAFPSNFSQTRFGNGIAARGR